MKTKSKRPSAPARRSRGQQRARSRLLHPRAGRRCTPRSRAPPMPRRRRRPFYSMGFARSAGALDIICAAGEASGSGVWRRLTRGRAQACVAWRRRAGAGREYRGAPGSARCLRSVPRQERLSVYWVLSVSGLAPSKLIQLAAVRPGLGRGNQLLLAFSRSMLGTAACSCRA